MSYSYSNTMNYCFLFPRMPLDRKHSRAKNILREGKVGRLGYWNVSLPLPRLWNREFEASLDFIRDCISCPLTLKKIEESEVGTIES